MEDFFAAVESRVHAWPAGRADLHWHALFDTEEVRRCLTESYEGLTHRPGLEPVEPEWVHMTVLHSGPHTEATAQELAGITERVRKAAADIEPFDVTFALPTIGSTAVECVGRPGPPARRLWEETWQATRAVVGDRWPLIPKTYHPHVTLAYGTARAAAADRAQMKAWLSDHGRGEVVLRASALTLVAQSHDRRRITWEVLETVPLGQSGA
ncbi:2'-5' RNA ligase family protein [Streptomyces spirodelae]|uniref:2'-5' RNA ligase family protein n=1 Tax=Streptomyces spirodelae TaxID=2812904 RepID=A0ABS3X1K9_9ACTN|nr:2'-5' RNA ligase family protein [Streptomyces spirodelae]MBO8189241.1 2'-5' RNA ligase family protein [Streptomyces spirodelae]